VTDVNKKPQVICACPPKSPGWDEKDLELSGHCVHEMSFPTFFHMPLAYDTYVKKQAENIEQLDLKEKWPGLIFTRTGFWRGKLMRLLEAEQTASRLVKYLPAPFNLRVNLHDGGMGTVAKTIQAQHIKMSDMGRSARELYLAHLTCPVCEDRKGGEKILVIRRWIDNPRLKMRLEQRQQKSK